MKTKTIVMALSAVLALTPVLTACGGGQSVGGGDTQGSGTEEQKVEAPVLDGAWRQEGRSEGENGMIGAIDGEVIALWFKTDDGEYTYWVGSVDAPTSDADYTWTSKADKGNMTGLFTSRDDTKEFKYSAGKISFDVTIRGETTNVVMEQASEEAGLLADIKSGEGKPVDASQAKDLEIVDSNYTVSDGYVSYVIAINNPNEEYAPQSVNIKVVGRAEDGSISFSDDWGINGTLPGATTYWANSAGSGNASESDTIEISISVDDDDWYKTTQKYDFYTVENVSILPSEYRGFSATGEITLSEDVKLKRFGDSKTPMLVCVLKDADGKLISGCSTFIYDDLKIGEATAFEIRSSSDAPDYATAEVYANPW